MKDRVFKKSLYSKLLRNKDFTYVECVFSIDTGLQGEIDLDVRHSYKMNFFALKRHWLICVWVWTLRYDVEVRGHIFCVGPRDWWTQADRLGSRHLFYWGFLPVILCPFKPLPWIMKKPNQLRDRSLKLCTNNLKKTGHIWTILKLHWLVCKYGKILQNILSC